MHSMLTLGFTVFVWMCLCGIKAENTFYQFDRAATVPLRGLLILFVILAHLNAAGVNPGGVFSWFMWQDAAVAVFFFMSGYGQMFALKFRPRYLDGMISRTARKLFLPLLLLALCALVAEVLVGELEWGYVLSQCKRGEFVFVPHIWYVIALWGLTIVFAILARWMGGGA